MSRKRKVVSGLVVAVLVLGVGWYNLSEISHHTIQLHLHLFGSSIYEYHAKCGEWPTDSSAFN